MQPCLRFVIVGNPENRRVQLFLDALDSMRATTTLKLESRVISYEDLLVGKVQLVDHLNSACVLRLESPGENAAVERQLIARGADEAEEDGCEWIAAGDAKKLAEEHGRIRYPKQLYFGFCSLLREIADTAAQFSGILVVNAAHDVATMFDKAACRDRLQQLLVPQPDSLPTPRCFEDLRQTMQERAMPRVFVKLTSGSSASGVVALQIGKKRLAATTSVELVRSGSDTKLYNSLRLRNYHNPSDISAIIDYLCCESVVVERWLPKATSNGMAFDLRIIVFPDGAQHVVVRQSHSPITNLHLGNARGDWDHVKSLLSDSLAPLNATCEKIEQAFPNSSCIAADVLVSPNCRNHAVLELNAFGDLLPGVLHNGLNTYQAIIKHMIGKHLRLKLNR